MVMYVLICLLTAEDLQQSLLDHYERADLELSLPPPGRTGAMRNMPAVKMKGDLDVSIEDHQRHMIDGTELFISYKICVKVCSLVCVCVVCVSVCVYV